MLKQMQVGLPTVVAMLLLCTVLMHMLDLLDPE